MAKKALSAYWIWLQESRAKIVAEHNLKGGGAPAVSKKAGEIWKLMGPEEKKKWEDLAAKDKIRYQEEVKTLGKRERNTKPSTKGSEVEKQVEKQEDEDQDGRRKRRKLNAKAAKDPDMPKKPQTGWMLFVNENRENIIKEHSLESKKMGPVVAKAGEIWKNSPSIQQKYQDLAAKLKTEYFKKLEEWKQKKDKSGEAAEISDDSEDDMEVQN